MRVVVTGNGRSGSWAIRGQQLGAAIGAEVRPKLSAAGGADVLIHVKRVKPGFNAGTSLVIWDPVDAWPQPPGNTWDRDACMAWLIGQIGHIAPDAVIAATQAMARDLSQFGLPVAHIPHHARPGLLINPIREKVATVAYEGTEKHVAHWRGYMQAACDRRGWRFVMNPANLADVDIVLAMRDTQGYAPRYWKSNVKLANAQGSGTPCVLAREVGYLETACGAEQWADTPRELDAAFDTLTDWSTRRDISKSLLAAQPTLEAVAKTYRRFIAGLRNPD